MSLNLAITAFDVDYVPNPNLDAEETPFDAFWTVREQILEASRKHGAVGPEDDAPKPSFYLVDDQYNDDLYQLMEIYDPLALTEDWLEDVCSVLSRNTGWAIALSFGHFSILIFADRLLVPADKFSDRSSIEAVLTSARKQIIWNDTE